ncbi:MAG: HlyD family secretion protein [Gemmatimonadaceae bacterium]
MPRLRLALTSISCALLLTCDGAQQSNAARSTGTIELTESDVAAPVAARLKRALVREGDAVNAGDTLAVLELATLAADVDQRRSRLRAAEAELRDLQAGARTAEITRSEADLAAAEAEAKRTADDARRLAELLKSGAVSEAESQAAATAARVAAGRRDAARAALNLLREGARPERIRAARENVASARAQLEAAESVAEELVLVAPSDGLVVGRYAEPGELLAAGIPVFALGDPRRLWVRVYVSAAVLATLDVGDAVRATIDALPGRSFSGRIVHLAPRAEFTPRVALTEEERADLLFGVRIDLTDPSGTLKAGLPVDVQFAAAGARPTP